jgi:putative oxidoreductase
MSMPSAAAPRPFISPLRSLYEWTVPLSYAVVRVAAGLMILPHGWPKLLRGPEAVIANFAHQGFRPAWLVGGLILFNETLGGLFVAAGFLTRLCAASIAIEMAVIAWGFEAQGYSRMEHVLMWGFIMFAITLGGGGPYSIDRKLGWEI